MFIFTWISWEKTQEFRLKIAITGISENVQMTFFQVKFMQGHFACKSSQKQRPITEISPEIVPVENSSQEIHLNISARKIPVKFFVKIFCP